MPSNVLFSMMQSTPMNPESSANGSTQAANVLSDSLNGLWPLFGMAKAGGTQHSNVSARKSSLLFRQRLSQTGNESAAEVVVLDVLRFIINANVSGLDS